MGRKRKNQLLDREEQRYGLFMNENSFDLEVTYGRNYLENDVVHKVKVYRINAIESKAHKLYGQAKTKDKKFMPPVEIHVMVDVEDNEQSYYGEGKGGLVREDTGKLQFGVYLQELEERQLDVSRGDIIEYNMSGERDRHYEVESAQNVTDMTSQTIAGYKPYWKMIVATPIKSDVSIFLKGDSFR